MRSSAAHYAASVVALAALGAMVSCGGQIADESSIDASGVGRGGQASGPCVAPDDCSKAMVLDGVCRIVTTLVDQEMIGDFAVDGATIYWTNSYDGNIEHQSLNGGTPSVLVRGLTVPVGLSIVDGILFWTELGTYPTYADGSVSSFVLDQGPSNLIAANQSGARTVVTDEDAVYWLTNNAVMKGAKSGAAPTTLASTNLPGDLVLDQGFLYWVPLHGPLMKIATTGGPPTVVADATGPLTMRNGRIYTNTKSSVLSIPTDGGPTEVLATESIPIHAVTADDDYVYWASASLDPNTDEGGTIKRRPLSGGPTTTIAAKLGFRTDGTAKLFERLYVDATHLYFQYLTGNSLDGRIYRVNK